METKRSSIQSAQTMTNFPRDPNEFMQVFPSAYGPEDLPVTCTLDEVVLIENCKSETAPVRNTNSKVHQRTLSASSIVPHRQQQGQADQTQSVNAVLVQMLQQFMNSGNNRPPSGLNRYYVAAHEPTRREPLSVCDAAMPPSQPADAPAGSQGSTGLDADSIVSGGLPDFIQPPSRHSSDAAPVSVHERLAALSADIRTSCTKAKNAAQKRKSEDDVEAPDEHIDTAPELKEKTHEAMKAKKTEACYESVRRAPCGTE